MSGQGRDAWEGRAERECGEHRSTGKRAWCFDCSEWCSPGMLCVRCEYPLLIAERDRYRGALNDIAAEGAPPEWSAASMAHRARAALGEQHGPRPACPECGMGGDVGGTEPNPIPF